MQRSLRRMIVLLSVALFTFLVDQGSKIWVANSMRLNQSVSVIGDFLRITYVHNKGIVFGLFNETAAIFWLTSLLGVGVIFLLLFYLYKNMEKFNMVTVISYGLIFGGGLGNTYDRFFRGYVIDFIDFRGIWSFIFNAADAFINIAMILLLIESFFKKEE